MAEPDASTERIRADIARLSDDLARKLDEYEGVADPIDIASEVEGFTASDVAPRSGAHSTATRRSSSRPVVPLLSREAKGWSATEYFFEDSFTCDPQESELRFLKRLVRDSVQMRNRARLAALELLSGVRPTVRGSGRATPD